MSKLSYDRVDPGPLSRQAAETINEALRALSALQNMQTSPGLKFEGDQSGNFAMSLDKDFDFPAQITDSTLDTDGHMKYAWIEIMPTTAGGWIIKPAGRIGSLTVNPAYEQNYLSGVKIGTNVQMYYGFLNNSSIDREFYFILAKGKKPKVIPGRDGEDGRPGPIIPGKRGQDGARGRPGIPGMSREYMEKTVLLQPKKRIFLKMPGGWTVQGSPAKPGGGFTVTDPLTTKGDQLAFSTQDARFGSGSNYQVEISDSGQPIGLNWANLFLNTGTPPNLTIDPAVIGGGGGGIGPWPGAGQKMYGLNCTSAGNKCYYIAASMYYSGTFSAQTIASADAEFLYAVPFMTPGGVIAELALQVNSIGTSSPAFTSRMGIYANHATLLYPTTLLADFGQYGPNNSPPTYIIHNATTFTAKFGVLYWLVCTIDWNTINTLSMPTYFDCYNCPPMQAFQQTDSWTLGTTQGMGWQYTGATYPPANPLPGTFPGSTTDVNIVVLRPGSADVCPCMGYYFSS